MTEEQTQVSPLGSGTKHPFEEFASLTTYAALGMAIVSWSQLEQVINSSLARLIGGAKVPDINALDNAMIACAGKDSLTSLGLMKTIISYDFPPKLKEFADLVDKIDKAYRNKRNVLAHYHVVQEDENEIVQFLKYKIVGKMKEHAPKFSREELWQMSLYFAF
jgi:hypothetical protein